MSNAFTFNGTTDYLSLPDIASGVGDFTFACKFNLDSGSAGYDLWFADTQPTDGSTNRTLVLTTLASPYASPAGNSLLGAEINGVSATGIADPSPPAPSTAHDMVVVRHLGTVTWYLDGASYAAGTGMSTATCPLLNIYLGAENDSPTIAGYFHGTLWQAGLWLSAWSSGDISNYHAGNDPTSIEWSTVKYYLPLQANTNEVYGSAVTVHGSPTLSGSAPTLAVTPATVGAGTTTTLTFTGTGTAWATGTARPIASSGTVGTDAIVSTTDRTTSFTAPGSAGTVTFTDPTTGVTTTLTVTQKKRRGGPGKAKLDFPLPFGGSRSRVLNLDTPMARSSKIVK